MELVSRNLALRAYDGAMRWLRTLGSAGGTLTAVAGGSTVADDLANYGTIARALGPGFFQWALIFLGIAIIIAANWDWISAAFFRRWLPRWRFHLERRDAYPIRRIIPFRDGVLRVMSSAEGTMLMSMYRSQTKDTPNRLPAWFAGYVARREEVILFGKEPFGSRFIEIPRDELRMCSFSEDCASLKRLEDEAPRYVDLHMKKADALLIARTIGPKTETILKG